MAGIFTNIEHFFKQRTILSNLIAINIILFLLFRILSVICTLLNTEAGSILRYFEFPSSGTLWFTQPWSILTYMFSHFDFLHILFNMLWLFWFGKIFLIFFQPKQLNGLYLLGGIAGALIFMLCYHLFPFYREKESLLIGASAAVMAIVFGAAFYKKDFEISLLLLGNIKIIYLALITLVLDILSMDSANGGGHIAHLGGAGTGILFAACIKKNIDITNWINTSLDFFTDFFKKKKWTKMKVKQYKRFESEYEYNEKKNTTIREIDEILDKIKKSGYNSLSNEEKHKLFNAGKK